MFQALFNLIFNLLATLIQVVLLPINSLVDSLLPDLTDKISYLNNNIPSLFNNINWFINILPTYTRTVLLFAIEIMIVKYTIYIATHGVVKIWNLFQKLKFW